MNGYVTAQTIRSLRERKNYTQKELAEHISVSDKAVSKWETGRGLPDVSLLSPLAAALGVSVAELLSGECITNKNPAANLQRGRFYVCPICGNVLHAAGEGAFSCCGIALPPLEAEPEDAQHLLCTEEVDGELFVSLAHPMEKGHFISFLAYVTAERLLLVKLWPEQNAETRFPRMGCGTLYAFCNRHGLFAKRI